ncbi:hypothetical protein [Caballeronia sp. GAFFF1]|uniref:hypothetical protein n=1 Tax=Caballeronia sp. GAFFF1 TaxID=2921779 RepID=UPI00202796BD|nr:hypothetical protein [Caballeronia sp. GAFFF1]
MLDFSDILIGVAALAAIGLVLLAHDWRDEYRERRAHRAKAAIQPAAPGHSLREWWLRHRH